MKPLGRRQFLSVALPALAVARCSRSEPVPSDDRRDVAAQETPSTISKNVPRVKLITGKTAGVLCLIDWMIAAEKGFFSAEGLDVEYLEQDWSRFHGHHLMSSWLKGPGGPVRCDAMVVEYPSLQDMASGSMDYYVVAGEHSGCRQIVCPVDSPIRAVADLRGKRIGLRPNEDTLMWEFLIGASRAGTDPTQWIRAPFPAGNPRELEWVKQEFAAGRIDAYISGDPIPEILKIDGVARLVASNTWTPPLNGWYCCMLAVRKELVDAHPDLPGRFTRAIRNAAAFVEEKPAEAVALAVATGYLPSSTRQDLNARLLGEYVWAATGRIEQDLERYFQLLIDAGRVPVTTPPRELVKRVYRGAEA
jgi:ABC-type nitrate/sulfonate/bicarbonate transport system substrate-binding protein